MRLPPSIDSDSSGKAWNDSPGLSFESGHDSPGGERLVVLRSEFF
jgi:hypothetical protein